MESVSQTCAETQAGKPPPAAPSSSAPAGGPPPHAAVCLPGKTRKKSSFKKALGNFIVSIVGCGVLGLPYAFKRSGWAFSLLALALMALLSYYGMLLLVKTRKLLESQLVREDASNVSGSRCPPGSSRPCFYGTSPLLQVREGEDEPVALGEAARENLPVANTEAMAATHGLLTGKTSAQLEDEAHGYFLRIDSYGELGHRVMGVWGQVAVDAMVIISQAGFCVAYLIFVGENVSNVICGTAKWKTAVIICTGLIQVLLSWVRSLSKLAPFSMFADVINICAFSVVIVYGLTHLSNFPRLEAFTGFANAPAALSVAVYSFEGVGNTLALEGSMREPLRFPFVLALGVAIIASMYGSVGLMGYTAFAEHTQQIVTLNLPQGWATTTVQLGLSVALCFTFPVMMYPVYEVYETRLCQRDFVRKHVLPSTFLRRVMFRTLRAAVICIIAYAAVGVPHFATFISLIGSSVCSLLGFVLPALLHLRVGCGVIPVWEKLVDGFLIVFGFAFAIWGTWDSVHNFLNIDKGIN